MRILYLTDRLSARGGADLQLHDVLSAFAAHHDVTVACGARAADVVLPARCEAVRLPVLSARSERERGHQALERLLHGADVVHVQNIMNPASLRLALSTGRAVVTVQDHRVFCPGRGKRTLEGQTCRVPMQPAACTACFTDAAYARHIIKVTEQRMEALREARQVVVLSRYMARELAAIGLGNVAVIPPWIDVSPPRDDVVAARHATTPRPLLLAGRLVAHKGVTDGWQAWRRSGVANPLRVAGAGRLAPTLAGAERLGWIPRPALRRELRNAVALLFPAAWEEPFGIVGLEALAEGTPVIVARAGGTDDWSSQGCMVVDSGDTAAMASAIHELSVDPARALRLGEQGRRAVQQRFARGPLVGRLQQIYDEVRADP